MASSQPLYSQAELLRLLADVITHKRCMKDVRTLLTAGADPNRTVSKGLRPIHYAAFENFLECVDFLIEKGAQVNVADDNGYTPLHIAAKHGHLEVARTLISHGAVVNMCEDSTEDLPEACKVLAYLTVHPLNLAIENDHYKVVELLLQNGGNANQKYFLGYEINMVPLENVRCLEVLLRYGANPDSFSRGGLTALMKACKQQNTTAVEVLLRYGASVNIQQPERFDQRRAIHFAAITGNVDNCQMLLEAGADTKIPPGYKYAPLELAVTQGKYEVCKKLLDYGADVNEVNEEGCVPLQAACATIGLKNHFDIIKLLLENGADPNQASSIYSYMAPCLSPIVEYFAYNDEYSIDIVKLLLRFGARVTMAPPTKLFKIKYPGGVFCQVHKLIANAEVLDLLLEASDYYEEEAITKDKALSSVTKELLMEKAITPRSLKHLCRLTIQPCLVSPLPAKVDKLPLPAYLKSYLLYEV